VAVIEVVSPGNKHSKNAIGKCIKKAIELLDSGVHLLIVDRMPPTKRDPNGIHDAFWQELNDEPFELPADKRLTLVSYVGGPQKQAFIEPVAVGDALPAMPLFLETNAHLPVPLEESYRHTFSLCPEPLRELIETGKLSDELRNQLVNYLAMHVGQPEVAAGVAVGELFVIEAEELEHGGMQVVDVDGVLGGLEAKFVG
jgi:hypothetical protein